MTKEKTSFDPQTLICGEPQGEPFKIEKTSFEMFKEWVENTDFKYEVVSIEKFCKGDGFITIKTRGKDLEIDFNFDEDGAYKNYDIYEDGGRR